MVYLTILTLVVLGLAGCSENAEQDTTSNNLTEQEAVTGTEETSDADEMGDEDIDLIIEDENSGVVSQLTRRLNGDDVNQIALVDVITNEIILSYEFDEYEYIEHVWTLNNGYHVAWVGEENLQNREFRIRQAQEGFGADFSDIPQDDRTEAERDMRMVIFNESLEYIESLPFTQAYIRIFNSALIMVDNELLIYGIRNMYPLLAPTWDVMRHNVHTGEVNQLFEHDREPTLTMERFADDHRIFVWYSTDAGTPQARIFYGFLNVETGQIDSFEPACVCFNGGTFFFDSKVILTERAPFEWEDESEFQHVFIVFDIETLEYRVVPLGHGESLAHPSFDENHMVTINESESMFRKYDLFGALIAEVSIDIPGEINHWGSRIIPITNESYLIRLTIGTELFGERTSHEQIVTLP